MSDPSLGSTPQFGTAEYAGVPDSERCQFCHQQIGTRYYRVNNAMACAGCAEQARFSLPSDSGSKYMRGLLFGIGGAILGLIIYATFEIATGWIIGYVSLAVGYIVGKAIKMGSRGAGGRKYQITAAALTYAAVSLAAVPVAISMYSKTHVSTPVQHVQQQPDDRGSLDEQGQSETSHQANPSGKMGFAEALLQLVFLGLASPFLELTADPFSGLIGLVILAVGIRIAWRLCAGSELEIYGPFENAKAASAS